MAGRIAKVEPLTTARSLRGPFDYRIPREMEGVGVGTMLVVPFGRRRVFGVVVGVAAESDVPPERLVEPISALESGVPAELVRLGLWLADAYCSTAARGLALVLPPGTGTARRAQPGARSRRLLVGSLTAAGAEALSGGDIRLGERQRAAMEALSHGATTATELSATTGADHGVLRRLAERGFVALDQATVQRRPATIERGGGARDGKHPERRANTERELTGAQRAALASLLPPLRERRHEQVLLHGVTGSGKTEVYLRAAAAALEQGRSAIVLVPEIALTPQTARRFEERFGDAVAILHSRLGLGERYDEWQRLNSGEARVCVGPRSAAFAPLRDLGLIVIDEEHDSAYKQEGDPRYDARVVAQRRAELCGALLICGSATPRPESWERMRRIDLPERVDGRPLPPVELVDMRTTRHALHRRTREALDEVKRRGAKAIVLVNRRGWSPFVVCRDCGFTWQCPSCDVTLTLHRDRSQALLCHHCGHNETVPRICSECSSTAVARHGTGTQRLEAELREALAPLPVFRLDADAARAKHGIAGVLDRFERAPAGILIGTQMVAQGHHFPEVALAVVQDADATLRFPDFRSEERTFSLVAQLAGRSGRGRDGGRVLVQTLCPEEPCLQHAAAHDAPSFLAEELERRRALRYPPVTDLIRVVTAAAEQQAADSAASSLRASLDGLPLQVLGPAPLFRRNGRYRSMLLVKTTQRATAVAAVGEAVKRVAAEPEGRTVSFAVDVDPQ
jgi:primosomal protein N' (replication factor Y) (superfamily II helicase)